MTRPVFFSAVGQINGSDTILRTNLYDGDALIGEYAASGAMLARYVHGLSAGDDPIVAYSGASTALSNARFLHADRLGSIVLSSRTQGASPAAYAYDEYGIHGSVTPPRFGYTGQVLLPEAGLYYYKARMYSPNLGRFMQPDPLGYGDGMNMYAYVGNNPVNRVDPSGLSTCGVGEIPVGINNSPQSYDGGPIEVSRRIICIPSRAFSPHNFALMRNDGGRGDGDGGPESFGDRICSALFAPDGQSSGTAELGVSGSANVPVVGGLVGNAGLVADGAGNVGLIFEGGKAFGVGLGGLLGARAGVSNASSIQQLEGFGLISSTTVAAGKGGAVDVGVAPSSGVISGGATVGLGGGFSASSAVTGTVVIPLFDLSELVGCGG